MKTIDARGLSCPEPVIRTKNALVSGEKAYTVMVDNVTAKENVSRFALHVFMFGFYVWSFSHYTVGIFVLSFNISYSRP